MTRSIKYRILAALAVTILGALYILPTFVGKDTPLDRISPAEPINLGLDLKGGVHLTVGVDMDKALENNLAQVGQDLRSIAREEGIVLLRPTLEPGLRIGFVLLDAGRRAELDKLLGNLFPGVVVDEAEDLGGGRLRYTLALTPEYRREFEAQALEQAVRTIRDRKSVV